MTLLMICSCVDRKRCCICDGPLTAGGLAAEGDTIHAYCGACERPDDDETIEEEDGD